MAQTVKEQVNLQQFFGERWKQNAEKLEQAAKTIPADKFDWRPTKDVRSCGEILRHVAFWNEYLAATIRGEKVDGNQNELPEKDYATRQRVMAALDSSNKEVSSALKKAGDSLENGTLGTMLSTIEHNSEHYGQIATYCRVLGIVPPASRG